MSDIVISPMKTESEICGKAYVHYKSWHETYHDLVDAGYLKTITLEKCNEIAHRWLNNILVAKVDEKVVGFVGYGAYHDDTLAGHGEIFSIYVLAEYHGREIGYKLMTFALEKLSNYEKIAVWVLSGNERAIRFYERYGFRFDGTKQEIILGTRNTELRMIFEKG